MLRRSQEVIVQKGNRTLQRAVLSKLFEHLHEYYGVDSGTEPLAEGQLTRHQLDALLAFKSDPQLDELRSALERLEHGTYGVCIGCKHEIGQEALETDPVRRICSGCEQHLSHGFRNALEPHLHL